MAFVITRLCRDCVDTRCVRVCPVDCILEHRPEGRASGLPNQLFINPEDCIDCGLCQPECPWEAIFGEDEVPAAFTDDIHLNALAAAHRPDFAVPPEREHPLPTRSAVELNRKRWGAL